MLSLALALVALHAHALQHDVDTDGDGLSDYEEVHKYRTDPRNADSDGDGVPDGDPEERREWTYSVRTRVRVLGIAEAPPSTPSQDARVVARGGGWVELEVVHYPLSTAHIAIAASTDWREHVAPFASFTASTATSRHDEAMRSELAAELAASGVDVALADDRTLAVETSRRLIDRTKHHDSFTTFVTAFRDGEPVVPEELAEALRARELREGRRMEDDWPRELFADGMFRHRTRGSCTSTAIYLAGGLRAVGLPTRLVLVLPVADANDPAQLELVRSGIRHHRVRDNTLSRLAKLQGSWASHTLNEVLVGGRWQRLDGSRFAPPAFDPALFGLSTQVLTVTDWADARMWETVGRRQELGLRDDVFRTANPYATVAIDDLFGPHATIDNPEPARPRTLEIADVWWVAARDRPEHVEISRVDRDTDRLHLILSIAEEHAALDYESVLSFWQATTKGFLLKGRDGTEIAAEAVRGFWRGSGGAERRPYLWFLLQIAARDRERMPPGAAYSLEPTTRGGAPHFTVAPRVTIRTPRER